MPKFYALLVLLVCASVHLKLVKASALHFRPEIEIILKLYCPAIHEHLLRAKAKANQTFVKFSVTIDESIV